MTRPGPLRAVASRPFLVVFFAVLGVAAGVAAGLVREPTYTAEGRVQVQLSASNPAGLQGSLSAGIDFASTYARAIEAPEVVEKVAAAADLSPAEAESRISASPVPDTAVIDVTATAASPHEAERIAEVASEALVDYSEREPDSGSNPSSDALLETYEEMARKAERLGLDETEARRAFDDESGSETRQALLDAATAARGAEARSAAAQTAYIASISVFTAPLELVAPAYSATSDRSSMLQLLGALGLVAGLILGAAIATLRPGRAKAAADGA